MLATWSFRVKYQWPDECRTKFEISPCTQTSRKRPSSRVLICAFNSDTESALRGLVSRSNRLDWLIFQLSGSPHLQQALDYPSGAQVVVSTRTLLPFGHSAVRRG